MMAIPQERWRYRARALAEVGEVPARGLPAAVAQFDAARAITIPVPAGVRVHDSVLVEWPQSVFLPAPTAPRPVGRLEPVEDARDVALRNVSRQVTPRVDASDITRIVDTVQARPVAYPVPATAPIDVSAIPLPPGYAAVQQAQQLAAAAGANVTPDQLAAELLEEPPDAMPASETPTLAELPIGKQPFEFLCGTAGVGKTWLARKLAELMNQEKLGSCVLCATTGIASINLGEGTTVHSFLGFFNNEDLREKYLSGRIQLMIRKWRKAGVRRIILDEISMLHADALTYITRAVDDVNMGKKAGMEALGAVDTDDDAPAGELPPQVGLTIVGDFAQLPPVPDEDPKNRAKKMPVKFAFESPEWGRYAAHTVRLTRVRRQDARSFISALHAIRRGDPVAALRFFTPDKFVDYTDDSFLGTTIFATNAAVERYNQDRLDRVPGDWITADTARWGYQPGDWKKIPDQVRLKVGATVMILANGRHPDTGKMIYANGDLGEITAVATEGASWRVRLHRTGREVSVELVERDHTVPLDDVRRRELIKDDKSHLISKDRKREIVGTISYMPIRCAFGSTVHKCQGLTLDTVQVNIRDQFYQRNPGMLFVALSRARTAEGLRIIGNQALFADRCRVEEKVRQWL